MAKNNSDKKYFSMSERTYPSKLLLTGEYSVLKGGSAVLIPLPIYGAHWKKFPEIQSNWGDLLYRFVKYLRETISEDGFLDLITMEEAFESGYFLESNVPQGCGLGSSGVFCAALYDAFIKKGYGGSIREVRLRLQLMENFFHGKSSGLDPLVSYYNQAILLQSDNIQLYKTANSRNSTKIPEVWLLDSQLKRSTATLVKLFEEYLKDPKNLKLFNESYLPLIEKASLQYLNGQWDLWYESIQSISHYQTKIFKPMIPDKIFEVWMKGLTTNNYFMKLCGAGGGGFFYIFSEKKKSELFDFNGIRINDYLSALVTD